MFSIIGFKNFQRFMIYIFIPKLMFMYLILHAKDKKLTSLFRSMNMRKTYKNLSPESVPAMPMVPSAQTFNLDIPENKSTMTTWNRTFIPMQLRTQPSNLPPSQLQRMNTTLGEQAKGTHWPWYSGKLVVRHFAWVKRMGLFEKLNLFIN